MTYSLTIFYSRTIVAFPLSALSMTVFIGWLLRTTLEKLTTPLNIDLSKCLGKHCALDITKSLTWKGEGEGECISWGYIYVFKDEEDASIIEEEQGEEASKGSWLLSLHVWSSYNISSLLRKLLFNNIGGMLLNKIKWLVLRMLRSISLL